MSDEFAVGKWHNSQGLLDAVDRMKQLTAERDALRAQLAVARTSINTLLDQAKETNAECARYREALVSISKNTCCDKCQEAALWAKAALGEKPE